ncbi:hypothetical protein ACVIYL_000091 [Bradyrhizobium sp. USDA 3315]
MDDKRAAAIDECAEEGRCPQVRLNVQAAGSAQLLLVRGEPRRWPEHVCGERMYKMQRLSWTSWFSANSTIEAWSGRLS